MIDRVGWVNSNNSTLSSMIRNHGRRPLNPKNAATSTCPSNGPADCLAAYIPPELVEIITGSLQDPEDITLIRAVSLPWRLSRSPPPRNILSPLGISFSLKGIHNPSQFGSRTHLAVRAVFLLRHHSDPSKSWMVSVQESTARKLLLRHQITYDRIAGSSRKVVDLLEWIPSEIARSYKICSGSSYSAKTWNAVFVSSLSVGNRHSDAMAVYSPGQDRRQLCAFQIRLRDGTGASQLVNRSHIEMEDFVNFNGRIYVVDEDGYVYMFNSQALQLSPMEASISLDYSWSRLNSRKRFLVSDGDLYMILSHCPFRPIGIGSFRCRIFKLLMGATLCYDVEEVDCLGDRLFFINKDCSFAVSSRDLPRPWIGNCVVLHGQGFCNWNHRRYSNDVKTDCLVFHLGDKRTKAYCILMSSLPGYSDLFTPPSSWIHQPSTKSKKKK